MTDLTSWMRYVYLQVGTLLITTDELDIEFTVKGSNASDANTADISVFNLSRKTRESIKPDQEVLLRAGYVGDIDDIFAGKVKMTTEARDQGDLELKITCITKGYATGLAPVKYPVGTALSTIIAAAFRNSGIPAQKIDDQGFTLESEYTSETSAAADLEYCTKLINGSTKTHKTTRYYVEANGGYFVTDEYTRSTEAVILSTETGLIDTAPENPDDGTYSRSIRSGMNHRIGTDTYVDLRSLTASESGTYKVVEYTHKYEGTEYTTECKVKPL